MLITKNVLRNIISEEYSKLIEGDVSQGRFGSAKSDEQPNTDQLAQEHEKQNFYVKALEIAGSVYGEEYKAYYQKKRDLKKQIDATTSARPPPTGAKVLSFRARHSDFEKAKIEDKINKEKKDLEPRAEKKIIRKIEELLFQTSAELKSSGSEVSAKYFMHVLTFVSSINELTLTRGKKAFMNSFNRATSELNLNLKEMANYYYKVFIDGAKQPTTNLHKDLSSASLKVQGVSFKKPRGDIDPYSKHGRELASGD